MRDYASAEHSLEAKSAKVDRSASSVRFSDTLLAYAILRVSFGANIFLHGLTRVMAGHAAFLAYLNHYFKKTPFVPANVLPAVASVLREGEKVEH